MNTEFYVAHVAKSSLAIFGHLSHGREEEGKAYEFAGFSLDEVALLAKDGKRAMKECEDRTAIVLVKAARSYAKRNRCPVLDIYPKVQLALRKAVEKFDPGKGFFSHLLGRVIKLTLSSYGKSLAIHRKKVLPQDVFGDVENPYCLTFQDAVSNPGDVSFRMDLENYVDLLEGRDRRILFLYDSHLNFREIADMVHLSPTAVSEKVNGMLSELVNRARRKLL